jgi:glutathione S-transferase
MLLWRGLEVRAMILIGQFDSPFVRRVGLALEIYGFAYEHRPWSVFGDAGRIALIHPLIRVPTLVWNDGVALGETFAILDALDERAGPERSLLPPLGDARRRGLRVCALAAGACDKLVSLVYEERIHQRATADWVARCVKQVSGALDALEADRTASSGAWWLGEAISHADIAVATMWRFLSETQSSRFGQGRWPALERLSETCEARPDFHKIRQPYTFTPPAT